MIEIAQTGGVRTLTLARPDVGNALNDALVSALDAALGAAFDDPALHTVVLAAQGRHFCTGFDLSDLEAVNDGDLLARFVRIELLLQRLWHAPLCTVALARGRVFGAGADLFACCDRRVAAPDTTFTFPGVRFGLVLGTRRLTERMGVDRARRCITEGEILDAPAAVAAGLASETAEDISQVPNELVPPVADRATVAAIRQVTCADHRDADLAALVRAAVRPGLRDRIHAYRAAQQAQREKHR